MAQRLEFKTVDGKQIRCLKSGLFSEFTDCGTRSNLYTYVFVGSIAAIMPAAGDEKTIQIVPEEVFSGKPDDPVTVITAQGLCLPKLAVGDRWLFRLQKRAEGTPMVLDYYRDDSRPVADAQNEIEMLRRLAKIGDFAILRGQVFLGSFPSGKEDANVQITAVRKSDNKQFSITADEHGHYEFRPLPAGRYEILAAGSHRIREPQIDLNGGACWFLQVFIEER